MKNTAIQTLHKLKLKPKDFAKTKDLAPNTRAEILKSFNKVWPLNKLKVFRCNQIGVT